MQDHNDAVKDFEAAMTVRAFLVGFKYFRQTPWTAYRLMNCMLDSVNKVYGPHVFVDFDITDVPGTLAKFYKQLLGLNDVDAAEKARHILFMAVPTMFNVDGLEKDALISRWTDALNAYPSVPTSLASVALSGSPTLATVFNTYYGDTVVPVYDERNMRGYSEYVPAVPADFTQVSWMQELVELKDMQRFYSSPVH